MFGIFKKKDPVCGMKQEKGRGIEKGGNWFCSQDCVQKYASQQQKESHAGGCCGGH